MRHRTLLPDTAELALEYLRADPQTILMVVRATRPESNCPLCETASKRVHSRYERRLGDLPWNGIPVRVHLRTRRFFCDTPGCEQRIFTERLPCTVAPHARRTLRLNRTLDWFTLALGGEAGMRLAGRVGINTSGDTLLRQLRRTAAIPVSTPRVLGVDDWAWRKGQSYGTILCDLERRAVIDLLPDRGADGLRDWLKKHPGVKVISRDRASAYTEAASKAAPQAVQVADRWHLLRNACEALQQMLESKHTVLREAAAALRVQEKAGDCPVPETATSRRPSLEERKSQPKRDRRLARYQSVIDMFQQGGSMKAIARALNIHRRTVRRWIRAGSFPERVTQSRRTTVERFADYLESRYQQGCHNATQLWRELREQGFQGGVHAVRRWFQRWHPERGPMRASPLLPARSRITGSPRQTAWLLLREPPEAATYLQELYSRSPEIVASAAVAREFFRMVRERDAQALPVWLESTRATPLDRFAVHLCRDEAAVRNALRLPWSNGQVEGQVHRLKLIKRQMYGRAKFDLLRLRVLHAA